MPAPTTADDLLDLLRKSRLVEPSKLDAYLVTHPGPYGPPEDLVRRLQAAGLLTPFQGEQLLRGKHRGYFLGKYKILDRIGMGGMGQVFLAEHVSMRRRAALKVLPPDRADDPYKRERFLREARATGQLDHPNLVRAFDVDTQDDVLFLIMEYVDGVTLHDLVTRHGPLGPHRAAYYVWQVAHGLAYMHAGGLIHRDIKPANLVLDRQGVVKILDLGLVRSQEEVDELTRGEGVKILGTADYLAPEQAIDCSAVDTRADVYALGASAYFLLTGRPPFVGDNVAQKLIAHQTKPVTPVRELRPEVPPELAAVVERMLAKKPADRFQTPAEVVAALDGFAADPPPPPTEAEIPAVVGGAGVAGAVSLSSNVSFASRTSGSSVSLGSSQSNGSALRYHSDRFKAVDPPAAEATKTATPPKPVPSPVPLKPASRRSDFAPPPPVLPAAATHNSALPVPPESPEGTICLTALFKPVPAPPVRTPARRKRVSLAAAFALTLAVAVWDVVVLTGATLGPRRAPLPTAGPPAEMTVADTATTTDDATRTAAK